MQLSALDRQRIHNATEDQLLGEVAKILSRPAEAYTPLEYETLVCINWTLLRREMLSPKLGGVA